MKKILLAALLIVLGAFLARTFILNQDSRGKSAEKQKQETKVNPEEEIRQIIKMGNEVFLKEPPYDNYNIGKIIGINPNNDTLHSSTAFLVDREKGIIATAAHSVINIGPGASEIRAKFGDKSYQTVLYKKLINEKEDVALLFLRDYNKNDFMEIRNFGTYQKDNTFIFLVGYSECSDDSNNKICKTARFGKIVTGYHKKLFKNKDKISRILPSFWEMRRNKIFFPPELKNRIYVYALDYCTNLDIYLKYMKELGKINFSIDDDKCGHVIDYKFKFLPGMSGAPIFNKSGEIIGVAAQVDLYDQGFLIAIPISEIESLLQKARKIHLGQTN